MLRTPQALFKNLRKQMIFFHRNRDKNCHFCGSICDGEESLQNVSDEQEQSKAAEKARLQGIQHQTNEREMSRHKGK